MKLQTQDLDRGWLVWVRVDERTIYVDDEARPGIGKAWARADALCREKAVSRWTLDALIDLSAENKDDAPRFNRKVLNRRHRSPLCKEIRSHGGCAIGANCPACIWGHCRFDLEPDEYSAQKLSALP